MGGYAGPQTRGISRCSLITNRFSCLSPVPVVTAVIVLTYFSWTHIVVYISCLKGMGGEMDVL